MFICPICQSPLAISQTTWVCDGSLNQKKTQHPFDVARQGYVNLLPVQNKKSKLPGDSQASVLARQRFLQVGFYEPLQNMIVELVTKYLPKISFKADEATATCLKHSQNTQLINWLDIGCGEGYYSQKIAQHHKVGRLIAVDISKPAIITLAKTSKQHHLLWSQNSKMIPLVTSAANLPLANNSVQGISSIFSPILPHELIRVLQKNGILLIAKPDEGHLASIRQGLFDDVREHNSEKFLQGLYDVGFELLALSKIENNLVLNEPQLADLLTMTPYSYRAKKQKREALLNKASHCGLNTQARFILYVLQKIS